MSGTSPVGGKVEHSPFDAVLSTGFGTLFVKPWKKL